jgi:hypothetical protein
VEDTRRLEAPWQATAAGEPALRRHSPAAAVVDHVLDHPGWILLAVWPAYLGSLLFAAPAAPADYEPPVWVEVIVTAFWLTLVAAALAALARSALAGYAASFAAAGTCVGLAIACTVTDHHSGGWWAYELGGALVLGAVSAAGLRRARAARSPH